MPDTSPPTPPSVLLSRNEAETLAAKAARGAGLPWGLAEEAGFAAGWLHEAGFAPMGLLLAYLEQVAAGAWQDMRPNWASATFVPSKTGVSLCPITLGASLLDFWGDAPPAEGLPRIGPIAAPLLLLPALAVLARNAGRPMALHLADISLTLTATGMVLATSFDQRDRLCGAKLGWLDTAPHSLVTMTNLSRPAEQTPLSILHALEGLALNTTVPPSAASRADAGSAGSDND